MICSFQVLYSDPGSDVQVFVSLPSIHSVHRPNSAQYYSCISSPNSYLPSGSQLSEESLEFDLLSPVLHTITNFYAAFVRPWSPARSEAMGESSSAGFLTLFVDFHINSGQLVRDLCSLLCSYLDATQCAA